MKAILVPVIIALGLSSVAYNQDLPDGPELTNQNCFLNLDSDYYSEKCIDLDWMFLETKVYYVKYATVNTTEEISTVCRECLTTVVPALTQCNLTQLVAMTQQVCEMATIETTAGVVMTTTESVDTTVEHTDMTTTVGDVMTTTIGDVVTTTVGDVMTTTIGDDVTTTVNDVMTTTIGHVVTTTVDDIVTSTISDVMTTTVDDVMTTSRGVTVTVNTVTLLAVFLTTVLAFTVY